MKSQPNKRRQQEDIGISIAQNNGHFISAMGPRLGEMKDMGIVMSTEPNGGTVLQKGGKPTQFRVLTDKGRSLESEDDIANNLFLKDLAHQMREKEKRLRSSQEESIVKKENIDMNGKYWNNEEGKRETGFQSRLENIPAPELQPTTLLGRVRKFFLSFKQ